jgi:hypothetical protein
MEMARFFTIVVLSLLLAGCGQSPARMEHPEDPDGRYAEQIAAAKRCLQQKEDWADRAEWEVHESGDGWEVTAWRVEHPKAKGSDRYQPWGYSVIELDRRNVAIDYHRHG